MDGSHGLVVVPVESLSVFPLLVEYIPGGTFRVSIVFLWCGIIRANLGTLLKGVCPISPARFGAVDISRQCYKTGGCMVTWLSPDGWLSVVSWPHP